ncbi:hypothetical protein [Roseobacter sp.]|uniref:hypothetical protein n=1 Tax=Roseobacter sp. TaxID=1907202 RepID=UPI00385B8ED2
MAALVLSGFPATAQQKVYEGEEAAALRCANTMAFTAVALESSGRIGAVEKQVMLDITIRILADHVTGTWAQKKAALRVVRDRRDVVETFEDFERFANQCLRQFPIN